MRISLKNLEAGIQNVVESVSAFLFPVKDIDITALLVEAMKTFSQQGKDGVIYAPNLYRISTSITELPDQEQLRSIQDSLAAIIFEKGTEDGYKFSSHPVIRFEADPSLKVNERKIYASNTLINLTPTSGIGIETNYDNKIPDNSFLIVNGTELFTLSKSVINIGRRADNDLVIDQVQVSRIHAQLRVVNGMFILFDLASSSGTKVNGKFIQQKTLHSGDVIQIGNYPLVFGQDESDV
jgi:hypothetical protein